jgi:hypothetical protein
LSGAGSIQLSGSIASGGTGTGYSYSIAMSPRQAFFAKTMSVLGFGSLAYAAPALEPTVDKVLAIPIYNG